MNRYLVLKGDLYYPDGGRDIKESWEDLDEACERARELCLGASSSWSEVFDLDTMTVVKRYFSYRYYKDGKMILKVEEDELDD